MDHYNYLTPTGTDKKRKIWWISFFIFWTMFIIGMQQELSGMDLGKIKPAGETIAHYQMMLFCAGLILLYFVPFCFFMNYTCRKMAVSRKLAVLGFFAGWFVPGWIAGDLNDAAGSLIRQLTSKSFNNAWGDSIEAPLVEETLKVLVVIWLLAMSGQQIRKHYLVAGMAVGMGFQVGEDLTYIEDQLSGSHHVFVTAIPFTITNRIAYCLGSHWCYTALVAIGIYLITRDKRKKAGILLILAVIISHALRDSGMVGGVLYDGLVDAIILVPMFAVYVGTLGKCSKAKAVNTVGVLEK